MSDQSFDDLPGWRFSLKEVSPCVWRVRGWDEAGRSVETTDTDEQAAIEWCRRAAREVTAHGRQAHMDGPWGLSFRVAVMISSVGLIIIALGLLWWWYASRAAYYYLIPYPPSTAGSWDVWLPMTYDLSAIGIGLLLLVIMLVGVKVITDRDRRQR